MWLEKPSKEVPCQIFVWESHIERENGKEDFPDEDILDIELAAWKMYFDGVVNQYWNGIGVLLITLDGSRIPLAVKLNFKATNNMAEYEASIAGMESLWELWVKEAKVFGDLTLVIAQAQKLWKVKEEHLKPYQQYLEDLTKTFNEIEYTIIPRAQNQFANALATLASMVEISEGVRMWLISVIFTWFLLSSYLLKLLVFLYFFDLIWFLYLSIHLCFEGMRRFQINLQGFYVQSGARPMESSQLTSSQAWIQEKTNPIKFKSNWSKESKEICTKSKSNSD